MQAGDFDEILSFGSYTSPGQGTFQPHASFTAQTNGSLSVKAAGLQLLPGGGESSIGSGKPLDQSLLSPFAYYGVSALHILHNSNSNTCI